MRVLWLSWKDAAHPLSGGAERIQSLLIAGLLRDGHAVTLVTARYRGALPEETRTDGLRIIRAGNRFTVYWHAYRTYRRRLRGWPDVIVDEMNTIPFFAARYAREPVALFIHQLCREIWFYEMWFPANVIGYALEPLYLRLLRHSPAVTVSESTKRDLIRHGFSEARIRVIPEAIGLTPCAPGGREKAEVPTVLCFGSIRPMKRTEEVIRAFEIAKREIPDLRLVIAGMPTGSYGQGIIERANESPCAGSIDLLGPVPEPQKGTVMGRAHVLCAASVKEGWGLTVTEAQSQGTPAIVYDVDGLRECVGPGGAVCQANTPQSMAAEIVALLRSPARYARVREAGIARAAAFTEEAMCAKFIEGLHACR